MKYIFIILCSFLAINKPLLAQKKFPIPTHYLNDWNELFSPKEQQEINRLIDSFNSATSNEIAIVTLYSTAPYPDIKTIGNEIANEWGVGKKDKDNGLLIALCVPCRNISINTGIGTEAIINDEIAQSLIQGYIPYLKGKQYYIGLKKLLYSLFDLWTAE